MKNLLRPHSSVAEYLLSDMDGLRIRFPQQALIEKLSKTRNSEEDLEDENLELSSFNLSLGELGTARLVTSIRQDQNIRVVLEFENTSYQGHPLDCGQHAGTGRGGTPASEGMTLLFDLKGQVVYRFQTK